jgi:hypothetical protein
MVQDLPVHDGQFQRPVWRLFPVGHVSSRTRSWRIFQRLCLRDSIFSTSMQITHDSPHSLSMEPHLFCCFVLLAIALLHAVFANQAAQLAEVVTSEAFPTGYAYRPSTGYDQHPGSHRAVMELVASVGPTHD